MVSKNMTYTRSDTRQLNHIRHIDHQDLMDALKKGLDDFKTRPSHLAFLCLTYPIFGFILIRLSADLNLVPLAYPLLTGLALVGPLATVGLCEASRRREMGEDIHWRHAFGVLKSPARGKILTLGGILLVTLFFWLLTAFATYRWTVGTLAPRDISEMLTLLFNTRQGWDLIIIGNALGFLFAAFVFTVSVVSFPMLIDRQISLRKAVQTSFYAVRTNPITLFEWGLMIAIGLGIGIITFLFGLIFILPILGHTSWHLYRKLVV